MPTRAEIIEAMQFPAFYTLEPINTSSNPAKTITYQFAGTSQPGDLPTDTTYTGWRNYSAAEMLVVREALDIIETVLNVAFTEVSGWSDPDVNFGMVSLSGSTIGVGGYEIWHTANRITSWDGFALFDRTHDITSDINTVLHEIGHAMGLRHSWESGILGADHENNHYTVMSYTADPHSGTYNDTLMLYDILSLQDIWGSTSYLGGDTTYTGPRTDNVDVIWDTGGVDLLDASARSNNVRLDLREGRFSTFGAYEDVVIAYDTEIERAYGGSGSDTVLGNALRNVLKGFDGADKIKGFAKVDRIVGGEGNDKLIGGGGGDKIWGGPGDDFIRGGPGNDKLRGGPGADVFVFGKKAKHDTILDFEDDIDTLRIVGQGNLSQVLAHATQLGDDVQFDFGGNSVLLVHNMTIADLTNDLDLR
jgi:hypothetical protein